jgi:putative hydrolase of the HAD superfamily
MDLRALLFDVNSTLVDIETDEGQESIYEAISRFLIYQGIRWPPGALRERYFQIMAAQRKASRETYPEVNVAAVWRAVLDEGQVVAPPPAPETQPPLPQLLAALHRALAHKRLVLYPDVRRVLDALRSRFALGVVTDAQSAYAVPELRAVGLADLVATVVVSGDNGYRKPDPRLFATALAALQVRPDQAIYVGNDMYCDIYGAQQAGLRAVFFATQYGRKAYEQVVPEYTIHRFADLPAAMAALTAG